MPAEPWCRLGLHAGRALAYVVVQDATLLKALVKETVATIIGKNHTDAQPMETADDHKSLKLKLSVPAPSK